MEGCMILVIVYWLVMVLKVDWIVVMDGGCIVEMGMYMELIVVGGFYVKFVDL